MIWVYEGHLGSLYATCHQQDFDDLYCDECGDYDWEVGGFETPEEFLSSYAKEIYNVDFRISIAARVVV